MKDRKPQVRRPKVSLSSAIPAKSSVLIVLVVQILSGTSVFSSLILPEFDVTYYILYIISQYFPLVNYI